MDIKVKILDPNAVIPRYAKPGDAGLDLTVTSVEDKNEYYEVCFGFSIEIPPGYFGLMTPRSGITNMNHMMKNSIGIIDAGYRGELKSRFKKVKFEDGTQEKMYQVGDKAAQLIILPYPIITLMPVAELSDSERGEGGFGHTGK